MLNVYFLREPLLEGIPYENDVEVIDFELTGSKREAFLLQVIEQGSYYSRERFTTRFGEHLDISEMSTGCKAAMAVRQYPDRLISLDECGDNAISAILTCCNNGNILMEQPWIMLPHILGKNVSIEVRVGDYWFDNLDRFSEYCEDEHPNAPVLFGGAHCIRREPGKQNLIDLENGHTEAFSSLEYG